MILYGGSRALTSKVRRCLISPFLMAISSAQVAIRNHRLHGRIQRDRGRERGSLCLALLAGCRGAQQTPAPRTRSMSPAHRDQGPSWQRRPLPPPPLRRVARLCLTVGAVLLVLCPYASLSKFDGALLPLSSGALLSFGAAAVLIAGSRTRSAPTGSDLPKPREERVFDGITR